MRGHPFNHGGIARRQILPGFPDPFSIFGNPSSTSSTQSSSSSITSSSSTSVSSTIPLTPAVISFSSSSSSSSSSVSSTSSTPSLTPLYTDSTPSPTPTPIPSPTPSSSPSVLISVSGGNVVTSTSIVPASASDVAATTIPKSFLQNKPLATGIFTVVGIIGVVILILIGTIWIRSASRRRLNREALDASAFDPATIVRNDNERLSSLEELKRVNSTGSSGFSHNVAGQAGVVREYLAPPMARLTPRNYWQTPPYHGQPPDGSSYDGRYPSYLPPRSLDLVYNSAHTPPPPHVNIIAPTPSTTSRFGGEISPIASSSQNMPATLQHGSLLNSQPVSPSGPGENAAGSIKGRSSYSKGLDMQEMPVAPPLPAKFGSDENEDDGDAYGGIDSDDDHEVHRSLKVANQ